jgi:hypothetical protein
MSNARPPPTSRWWDSCELLDGLGDALGIHERQFRRLAIYLTGSPELYVTILERVSQFQIVWLTRDTNPAHDRIAGLREHRYGGASHKTLIGEELVRYDFTVKVHGLVDDQTRSQRTLSG